jgi:hypothetical protein
MSEIDVLWYQVSCRKIFVLSSKYSSDHLRWQSFACWSKMMPAANQELADASA